MLNKKNYNDNDDHSWREQMMDSEMEVVTSEMFHFSNLFTAVRNDKESHLSKYLFRLFVNGNKT